MDIDVEINEGEAGELQEKINELTSQLAEANDKYLRLYAEYDNYRKRTTKEKMEPTATQHADALRKFFRYWTALKEPLRRNALTNPIKAVCR